MTHWRTNTSGRLTAGAYRQPSARADTQRDYIPLLPKGSILFDNGFVGPSDRNRLPEILLSLGFLVPMILVGIMLHFR